MSRLMYRASTDDPAIQARELKEATRDGEVEAPMNTNVKNGWLVALLLVLELACQSQVSSQCFHTHNWNVPLNICCSFKQPVMRATQKVLLVAFHIGE
jgi:hypothetical protein